jgi:hypothetical protein
MINLNKKDIKKKMKFKNSIIIPQAKTKVLNHRAITNRTHNSTYSIICYLVHADYYFIIKTCQKIVINLIFNAQHWDYWVKISYSAQKSSHSSSMNLSIDSDSLTTPLSFNLFRLSMSLKMNQISFHKKEFINELP